MPFSFNVQLDITELGFRELNDQILEAAQRASNNVAFDIRKAYIKAAKDLFHNPTPFFTNAWFVTQTRDFFDKTKPTVSVTNEIAIPYWEYALEGGVVTNVTLDRITRRFRREGLIKARETMVGTGFLRRDRYDNIPPTFYQHFFTQLTPYKRGSNNSIVRLDSTGRRYFILRSRRGALIVFDSRVSGKPIPIMTSTVLSPARQSTFDLNKLAEPGLNKFSRHFDRQFAKLTGGT